MATKVSRRATVTENVPAALMDLELPPGYTLDNWVREEKARIKRMFPIVKTGVGEVGGELREMKKEADRLAKQWEIRRQLVNLLILERMGFAKKAAGDGEIFAEHRMYDIVDAAPPVDHEVNALFPASS